MTDSGEGAVERTFEHLAAADWDSFGALLSSDVERIGPFGERLVGRDAYVDLMSGGTRAMSADDGQRTSWDVHCIAYTNDRRSAFARITAHVPHNDRELEIEQTIAYKLDDHGLITRIEVFWRHLRS
ncbi:MAG: nuclear transport factor 2 family protein [Acidimicrobiia bacterium]